MGEKNIHKTTTIQFHKVVKTNFPGIGFVYNTQKWFLCLGLHNIPSNPIVP